jgi:hypothetical protein
MSLITLVIVMRLYTFGSLKVFFKEMLEFQTRTKEETMFLLFLINP